jgi:hypothetical protein
MDKSIVDILSSMAKVRAVDILAALKSEDYWITPLPKSRSICCRILVFSWMFVRTGCGFGSVIVLRFSLQALRWHSLSARGIAMWQNPHVFGVIGVCIPKFSF